MGIIGAGDRTMTRAARQILDHDFLTVRHGILDVAAALDRIDRGAAPQDVYGDTRMAQIRTALSILSESEAGRAHRVQTAFSRPYDPDWRR